MTEKMVFKIMADVTRPYHVIDFDKVKTLDDVIRILKALNITFSHDFPNLQYIEDLTTEKHKEND